MQRTGLRRIRHRHEQPVATTVQGQQTVGGNEVGIQQPTLSQQLAVLRAEELVTTRRDGKNIYYSVASPQVLALLQVLYSQFCAPPARKGRARR